MFSHLFTIITATYNDIEGLISTWSSIKSQACEDYEWIIVDGGSDCNTIEKIKEMQPTWSISEPDKGVYDAMNKGISLASGQYLIFLNSGDCFVGDDVLGRLKDEIIKNGYPDILYGDSYELDEVGIKHYKQARSHQSVLYGMFAHHQAMVFNSVIVADLKYDLDFKIAADYKYVIESLAKSSKLIKLSDPIVIFEGGGLSSINAGLGEREQWTIRRDTLGIGLIIRLILLCIHTLSIQTRKAFPGLYKALRYSAIK